MKKLILIFICLLFAPALRAEEGLTELKQCIAEYQSVAGHFARRIPTEVLGLDRRLYLMHKRVVFMQANFAVLEKKMQSAEATKYDALMVGNSLVNCRTELAQYRKYMTSLYYFFLSCLVSLVAAIAYFVYIKLTGGRLNARPFEPPKAEDRPADKRA